ncbi:MAG: 50S ribosomal protein L17 [Patescibacteria group bacterium]
MSYHKTKRKFGREKNQRVALMKSLALALAVEGKIKTTEAKAKELRPYFEKLITLGKTGTPASRRLLEARVGKIAGKIIATDLSKRFEERKGGYTRITKMVRRLSDGAPQAVIEFV